MMTVLFLIPLFLILLYLLVFPGVYNINWTIKTNNFYEKYFVENSLPEHTQQLARWRSVNCDAFFGILVESDLQLPEIEKYYNKIKSKKFELGVVLLNPQSFYWRGEKLKNNDSLADNIGFRPLMNSLSKMGRKQGKHYFVLYIAESLDGVWYSLCD